ncbi:MAG: hypothetical protein K0B05_14425 [Bacteroidales bacterium]|nr:hypothetical protein [Bacteroidales bacterium]
MSVLQSYYSLKKMHLFAGTVLATVLISWLSNLMLIDEVVFYNTFSEQLTWERSLRLFENLQNISWVGYVFVPVILFIKFSLISLVIFSGVFLFGLHQEITLDRIFRVVTASEIIIIFASLLKFLWFLFFAGNYTLNDLNFFYPLSLINLFSLAEVNTVWVFPLQIVNIFQMLYILSLSTGMNRVSSVRKADTEKIVLTTYIPALVIWVAFIMFLTLDAPAV